jgi:hypothetical protein
VNSSTPFWRGIVARDIETYLRELQTAMVASGADPALVQDALFDAEEYLQAEVAVGGVVDHGTATYEERFAIVVEGYGTPEEVAAAYLGTASAPDVVAAYETALASTGAATARATEPATDEKETVVQAGHGEAVAAGASPAAVASVGAGATADDESTVPEPQPRFCRNCGQELHPGAEFCTVCGTAVGPVAPSLPTSPAPAHIPAPVGVQAGMAAASGGAAAAPSVWQQIFGVFADPAVYKALVYMILSLGTGIAYFTIVVTGVSMAAGMLVLIIGIPLFVAVLGLVRAMALLEGRIVELLLGTRMPRRLRSDPPGAGILQRMWFWVKDGRTWASMAYMVLMLPLGTIYFTIAVTGIVTGLVLITSPVWGWFADGTFIWEGVTYEWWFPTWGIPLAFVGGVVLLICLMHIVRWIGRGHAAFAKALLVRLAK